MNKLHNLKPHRGAVTKSKVRLGRGQGSQKGGSATKGTKGQQARAGYSRKFAFEGGQMPLARRLPKRIFGSKSNRRTYKVITTDLLQTIVAKSSVEILTKEYLQKNGYISKLGFYKVLLGKKPVTLVLNVTVDTISKAAKETIEAKGGTISLY